MIEEILEIFKVIKLGVRSETNQLVCSLMNMSHPVFVGMIFCLLEIEPKRTQVLTTLKKDMGRSSAICRE